MASTGSDAARVDRVRRAEVLGELELAGVEVDADDDGRPGELRPGHGGTPDAAAAEDGHAVSKSYVAGEHRRTESRHHATPEQPRGLGPGGRVDLRALAGGHERLVGERADAQSGGERGSVEQCHLLRRVVRGEAVPGPPAPTGAALPADGAPIEDDEVAGREVTDVRSHGLDHACGLVAQEEGELVVDAALAVVEIGVADAAGPDGDDRLTRTGIRHDDRLQGDGSTLRSGHDPAHLLSHWANSSPSASPHDARSVGARRRRPKPAPRLPACAIQAARWDGDVMAAASRAARARR